jgi:RHS repeat-associated protein
MTTDLYYDEAGQVVEEQQDGQVTNDYVWSLAYVNAMVARISYGSNGSVSQILFAQSDANFNITSLVDGTPGSGTCGQVVERFLYDPYGGGVTITNTGWTPITGATPGADPQTWIYLFQGGRYDVNTGNYSFGARDYSPKLQRWTQLDPAGYPDGANAYGFVNDNPVNHLDPTGRFGSADMFPPNLFVPPANNPDQSNSQDNAEAAARAAASSHQNAPKTGSCSPGGAGILNNPNVPGPLGFWAWVLVYSPVANIEHTVFIGIGNAGAQVAATIGELVISPVRLFGPQHLPEDLRHMTMWQKVQRQFKGVYVRIWVEE